VAVEKYEKSSKYRCRDWGGAVTHNDSGTISVSVGEKQLIVLQEIRDELTRLNALLHCTNTLKIPRELSGLRRDVKALAKQLAAKGGV
jgi:hypothetical protein